MLIVNIELWPFGNPELKRNIGTIVITNDGTGNRVYGNYDVVLSHSGKYDGKRKEPWKKGKVKTHDRELSPYHLVYKAIKNSLNLK